jgi:thioesterase domain-containing protein
MTDDDATDKLHNYLERVMRPARARPTFDAPLAVDEVPQSVKLSEGPARTGIVGIPSTVAPSGPHQYLEFAKSFRDIRNLFALSVPGFVGQERLPASVQVAVEVQAEAAQRCMDGAPAVIVGYSSGGTFAYGIASHLEGMGVPIAGVVLIDAYSFDSISSNDGHKDALLRRVFEDRELRVYLNETRLTAMAWYSSLFMEWELTEIAAPTLLVQPEEPMPTMSGDSEWRSVWRYSHDTVEVPGDHWTMMMENAASTAVAVEEWISRVA